MNPSCAVDWVSTPGAKILRTFLELQQNRRGAHVAPILSDDGVTAPAWSPDGTLIAFSAVGGENDISVVTFQGDARQDYPTVAYGQAGTISWHPYEDVIYQQAGDQGFRLLDSESGEDRILFESEHWAYNQIPSPWRV